MRDLVLRGSMMNNLQQPINSTISYIPSTSSHIESFAHVWEDIIRGFYIGWRVWARVTFWLGVHCAVGV